MDYQSQVYKEALRWSRALEKRPPLLKRTSKRVQTSINERIPDKIHDLVTESVRKMVEVSLTSSEYIHRLEIDPSWNFQERESLIKERLKQYKKLASLEGAGTGLGGFWLGAADFPLLLSFKMKFLFDMGQLYGLDVRNYEEKVYLLHLFMLAFSSEQEKDRIRKLVLNWEDVPEDRKKIEWRTLQTEYRDSIDFVKLLQLVPGLGAFVGYVANGKLLAQLGETAMNGCRLRLLRDFYSSS
ncbi:EcsC family protein [Halobacillus salinarum]|uniref:EcsC family protein n=1 Tax=Halobacillus salinarum TaxID=2932257 RepID=A0ABY4EH93_9BACI|nr:EcsC family protein [Halobacillus salinarum]UOQ43501.1 EcsC family protein [Halobacillus salinarum]